MSTNAEAERLRDPQPRSLIVTVYGLYARDAGGWLGVGSVVRLMAEVGVDEPAVRSSISRLKRHGILVADKVDRVAGYSLSERATQIFSEGDWRIFQRRVARADDRWLLVVFSVPESEREKRHTLRSRLSWLGFGTVSSGVWIGPAHLEPELRRSLERHGLAGYVDLFAADHIGFEDLRAGVAAWWDLDGLADLYDQFTERYAPVVAKWRRRRVDDDADAFADYVRALTQWRRLPYLDPGLAPELLPPGWAGARAAEVFSAMQDKLALPAHRFVESVTAGSPRALSVSR